MKRYKKVIDNQISKEKVDKNGITFPVTSNNQFSGIFSYLKKKSSSLIENEVNFTASSINSIIPAKFLNDIYYSYSNDKSDFNNLITAIIDSLLHPSLRCNEEFLLDVTEYFINVEIKYLPIRTAHLIGFLIKTKDDACICQALKLCSMLNEEQLAYTTIAQDYFDQNIKG